MGVFQMPEFAAEKIAEAYYGKTNADRIRAMTDEELAEGGGKGMNDFICANCKHGKKYRADCEWEYMYDGTDYANDCCDWWEPTNADRIRSMTDEELAEWIISITEDDTEGWLDWLKKEAVSDG